MEAPSLPPDEFADSNQWERNLGRRGETLSVQGIVKVVLSFHQLLVVGQTLLKR
jgi:hypothetical protein